jgi:single-stranded-DNA-specific exonuclease
LLHAPNAAEQWMSFMLEKRWVPPELVPTEIARQLPGFAEVERRLLVQRGIRDSDQAERFLQRQYGGEMDPFAITDMEPAVERLVEARQTEERVVVYGDYDADGVTATALMVEALQAADIDVEWYVPDRFTEGYGLNSSAIAEIKQRGANLLVSVDCGIRAVETIREAGLDIIVTDHHLPGPELPPAVAVIDPNRSDDRYPFKGLAGVGIAFKLAQALALRLGLDPVTHLLDLVAVGTVADLAPLRDENRHLVWQGIEQLNTAARPGLRALAEHSGYGPDGQLSTNSLGYGLGPRLNAAGRLADAGEAVRLLLAHTGPEAWPSAAKLEELNRLRQRLTAETVDRAREIARQEPLADFLIFAVDADFHEGVIGLVASRLADEGYRPSLVARSEHGLIKGSARSIPEFHITNALDECADLLIRYGGHKQAAGFSLAAADLEPFAARMDDIARQRLSDIDLKPSLQLAAQLDFSDLSDELMDFIERLEPSGEGNPYPIFATEDAVVLSKRAVGAQKRHLKLSLRQANRVFDAIAFGFGDQLDSLPREIDVAYRLERNLFRGVVSLQLNVQDLRARVASP